MMGIGNKLNKKYIHTYVHISLSSTYAIYEKVCYVYMQYFNSILISHNTKKKIKLCSTSRTPIGAKAIHLLFAFSRFVQYKISAGIITSRRTTDVCYFCSFQRKTWYKALVSPREVNKPPNECSSSFSCYLFNLH